MNKTFVFYTMLVFLEIEIRFTESRTCALIAVPKVLSENAGKILNSYTFLNITAKKLVICGLRCMRQRRCKSINYHYTLEICSLNSKNHSTASSGMIATSDHVEHYSIKQWPQEFLGACKYHNCLEDEVCVSTPSNGTSLYTCADGDTGGISSAATSTECTVESSCADCIPDTELGNFTISAVGCYATKLDNYVLSDLLQTLTLLQHWFNVQQMIDSCTSLALENGFDMFGLADFGNCWAGNSTEVVFPPEGEIHTSECSLKCWFFERGIGGFGETFVYQINTLPVHY